MAAAYREASSFSHKRLGFALGTADALADAKRQVAIYGAEHVERVHALTLADALRERIPDPYYSLMFKGSGFAARMAALDDHDRSARATLPVRPPESDEESLGAFVRDATGGPPPEPLERHPSLPAPAMARVSELAPEAAAERPALPEFVDMGAKLREWGLVGGDA
jgi:hypothetical protein